MYQNARRSTRASRGVTLKQGQTGPPTRAGGPSLSQRFKLPIAVPVGAGSARPFRDSRDRLMHLGVNVQPLDSLIHRRQRNLKPLGGFGPVTAVLQRCDNPRFRPYR